MKKKRLRRRSKGPAQESARMYQNMVELTKALCVRATELAEDGAAHEQKQLTAYPARQLSLSL